MICLLSKEEQDVFAGNGCNASPTLTISSSSGAWMGSSSGTRGSSEEGAPPGFPGMSTLEVLSCPPSSWEHQSGAPGRATTHLRLARGSGRNVGRHRLRNFPPAHLPPPPASGPIPERPRPVGHGLGKSTELPISCFFLSQM